MDPESSDIMRAKLERPAKKAKQEDSIPLGAAKAIKAETGIQLSIPSNGSNTASPIM